MTPDPSSSNPVDDIPNPDEWRERDGVQYDYDRFERELKYLVDYQYIRAVHQKRIADQTQRIADWIAWYLSSQQSDDDTNQ